jgi:16S rRNA (guanine966-N2)-methyltransferase
MRQKKLTTNIIAGKYKGKLIELPSLEVTRSSKSILRESFFNVIQNDIHDVTFIEAFGGSGLIGLEALSRGAKESYFIEINKNSFNTLRKNSKAIDPLNSHTIFGDTFSELPKLVETMSSPTIVYIDPPFDFRDGMEDIYDKSFDMVTSFANESIFLICFEHLSGLNIPDILGSYKLQKTKKFGKSSLSYFIL